LGNDRGQLRIAKRFLKLLHPKQKLTVYSFFYCLSKFHHLEAK